MSQHDEYDITKRQYGTNAESAVALLDRQTEAELYTLYRQFFQKAEERNWNLWTDIPWEQTRSDASPEIIAAVQSLYDDGLFLPDYSARLLHYLRASRGRAWFITRWSYEEGKHLLTLTEWLTRSGAVSEEALRIHTDERLTAFRWEPPSPNPFPLFWDALLWEQREIERVTTLQTLSAGHEDAALTDILAKILTDETAHSDFLTNALQILARRYRDAVDEGAALLAKTNDVPGGKAALLTLLR